MASKKNTDPRFVYSADLDGDAEYVFTPDPRFSIQVALYAGGYFVNMYGSEKNPSYEGDFYVKELGGGCCYRSLAAAQAKVLEEAEQITATTKVEK